MQSDIDIARAATLKPITEIGARLSIPAEKLIPFGMTRPSFRKIAWMSWQIAPTANSFW